MSLVIHAEPALKKRKLNTHNTTENTTNTNLLNDFLQEEPEEEEEESDSGSNEDNNHNKNANKNDNKNENENEKIIALPSDANDWESLDLDQNTLYALHSLGFHAMMEIQKRCIPQLLLGHNMVVSAETGSGKTLAFLIPMIERMLLFEWNDDYYSEHGVGSLILSPTRELAIQTRQTCLGVCEFHPQLSVGLLIGGNPKHSDKIFITRGMAICVCTPGRLLDHLLNTPMFVCTNVRIFIVDEADRILDEGYEQEVNEILKFIPNENRQTMLFSATQTKKTKDLIRLSFNRQPTFVNVNHCHRIPTHLQQGFIVVPTQQKFLLLFSFLKREASNRKKKILVFFSTVAVTKYFVQLLNYIDIKVFGLHGAMTQSLRSRTFREFGACKSGILLATNIAARGLDFDSIDWIVQFDPSADVKNYIHRVGRTCRGVNDDNSKKGKALLFLIPEEKKYLQLLKEADVQISEYHLPSAKKIALIQTQLEKITSTVYHLHVLAHNAFQAYVREYGLRTHSMFDVLALNIIHVAKMFGLCAPPKISVEIRKSKYVNNHQKNSKRRRSKIKEYKTVTMRLPTNKWAHTDQKPSFVLH